MIVQYLVMKKKVILLGFLVVKKNQLNFSFSIIQIFHICKSTLLNKIVGKRVTMVSRKQQSTTFNQKAVETLYRLIIMNAEEILKILEKVNAIQYGHFILSSGKRSSTYCQCAKIFVDPKVGSPDIIIFFLKRK